MGAALDIEVNIVPGVTLLLRRARDMIDTRLRAILGAPIEAVLVSIFAFVIMTLVLRADTGIVADYSLHSCCLDDVCGYTVVDGTS